MISLYEILNASSGQLFGEPTAQIFDNFCIDAEFAEPGQLFVALKSEHGDTHRDIEAAIARGVSGVICSQPPDCDTDGVSVILVRDAVDALLEWSHYILGKFGTKVIAVAGSAGKSVAVDAIARVLSLRHNVYVSLQAETTGRLSVPLSLAKLRAEHRFAVIKLNTGQPGTMAAMVEAIQPEVGVITNIGEMYTEYFNTPDEVAAEKRILVNYLNPSGLAVLNYDDDLVRGMATGIRAKISTIGMNSYGADMMVYNVNVDRQGTGFDLRYGSERYVRQNIPLFGSYHLYSVMSALTVGLHFDIALEQSLAVLNDVEPLPGRMKSLTGINDCLLMDDTYSANQNSTLAALDWLASIKTQIERIFFVFGSIGRLGRANQLAHRNIGKRAAKVTDVLVTQGVNASLTARAALDYGMDAADVHVTYTVQDAVALLNRQYTLGENDIVLVAGGATSRMEHVIAQLLKDPADREQLVRQGIKWAGHTLVRPGRLTWFEVDMEAVANNVRLLKAHIGEKVTLMTVVKADAYGHGAVMTARTALLNGAEYLGVSSIQEALELRDAGIRAPILMMNYTPPQMARQAVLQDITTTVYDLSTARMYNRVAVELNKILRVHLKIDSGMGRLGTLPEDVAGLFRHLLSLPNLRVEGIYTHYSTADEDPDYVKKQTGTFKQIVRALQSHYGVKFKYVHAANSAATIAHKETHFDMVRPGLAVYGMHPSDMVQLPQDFRPALSWKTQIVQVKTLPAGHPVGYGNTYITEAPERVAIIPVGYGDGFRRAPENWGEVLVHGQRAPILGRVSMEKTIISVAHIPNVALGDEVVLLGQQQNDAITAEEVAQRLGTNNYEVTCSVLPRLER